MKHPEIFSIRVVRTEGSKLHQQDKGSLDEEIRGIVANPSLGVEKKGDLRGVFVHKFKINTTQYLLAYRLLPDGIELIMLGVHENYYRDLKSYLKKL